jgi:hypothetical protein
VHGVTRLEGVMDPMQGRFVLHGHLRETPPIVTGPTAAALMPEFDRHLQEAIKLPPELAGHHGPLVLRIRIDDGQVESCQVVTDRVIHPDANNTAWATWLAELMLRIRSFRATAGAGEIIQPLMFGNPVNLR